MDVSGQFDALHDICLKHLFSMWFNQIVSEWNLFQHNNKLLHSLLGTSYSEPCDNATGQSIL